VLQKPLQRHFLSLFGQLLGFRRELNLQRGSGPAPKIDTVSEALCGYRNLLPKVKWAIDF
jgi:hypothetical protein